MAAKKKAPVKGGKKKVVKGKGKTKDKAPAPDKAPATKAKAGNGTLELSVNGKKKKDGVVAVLKRSMIHIVKGFNPRRNLTGIEELAENIKRDGLLHFLVVRPRFDTLNHFDVVAGERRLRALDLLEWTEVPCVIRKDLEDDDAKAKAVAVAENSEDLDHPLNYIEIGIACLELQDEYEWAPPRIAAECGINIGKVRRALKLMEAPADVQKQVATGDLSMIAAVEVAKLDPNTRKKISESLHAGISADGVRKLAKSAAKEAGAKGAPGKSANTQKGAKRTAALVVWKGSTVKQALLRQLCYSLHNAEKGDVGTTEYHEIRGSIGLLLWDRGDIDEPLLPPLDPNEVEKDKKGAAKFLKEFNSIVKAESEKFVPDSDEEEEEEDE